MDSLNALHWQDPATMTLKNMDFWFRVNQPLLVSMARTSFGRDILGIPRDFPRVVRVTKSGITGHLEGNLLKSRFESGHFPVAKRLRMYAGPFMSFSKYFHEKNFVPMSPLTERLLQMVATVSNFTADTADQGITGTNTTWSTIRDTGSNLALEALGRTTNFVVTWNAGGGTGYVIYRLFTWWATGATIDAGDTISAASINIYYPSTHAAISRTMYVVENRQATTALATTDWTLIGASGVGTGTGQPFGSYTRGVSEAAGAENITLNSDAFAKIAQGSGNTFFTFVEDDDWNNNAPGAKDTAGSDFNSADAASNKPDLEVTHAAAASTRSRLLLMGVA